MPLSPKREVFALTRQRQGEGKIGFAWHPEGALLATFGQGSNIVSIWDRSGSEVASIALKGPCVDACWEPTEGAVLAIATAESATVMLWDAHARKASPLESGLKGALTRLAWSRAGQTLALCADSGAVAFYSHRTQRRRAIKSGLSSPITHCTWSAGGDGLLALTTASSDLRVIAEDGTTVMASSLRGKLSEPHFSSMKSDSSSKWRENAVSLAVGGKSLYLFDIGEPDAPIELTFQEKYGRLVTHEWFGDGFIMLGFHGGYFVVMATSESDLGRELHSAKLFSGPVVGVQYNAATQKASVCGDHSVKLLDRRSWKSPVDVGSIPKDVGALDRFGWTTDGQIISVSTDKGMLFSFLTKVPSLSATSGSSVAMLSSLRSITVSDLSSARTAATEIAVSVEPSFIALGPQHVVAGLNNKAWFHLLRAPKSAPVVIEHQYPGSVEAMCLNDKWAAALFEGKLFLHSIDKKAKAGAKTTTAAATTRAFPEKDTEKITDFAMTSDFLVFGTDHGTVAFFYIPDWSMVIEYHHIELNKGIKWVFPNATGTRVLFVDSAGKGFLFNPVNDSTLAIPEWTETVTTVMWDRLDASVFVTATQDTLATYTYSPITLVGPAVSLVTKTPKPSHLSPMVSVNGLVSCQDASGVLSSIQLASHGALLQSTSAPLLPERRKQQFSQALKLNRIREAWSLAQKLNNPECWAALGQESLTQLDVQLAIIAYRQLGDAGMVDALEQISTVEDMNLLAAHANLLRGNYNEAQRLFLLSPEPLRALQMRRDLMHWEHATQLAKTLAPEELPSLSAETATQLEFKGDYQGALEMYLAGVAGAADGSEQYARCAAGAARMTLRVGDVSKGMIMAQATKSSVVLRDCAAILESLKQFNEAADLYAQAGMHDKAAQIYIKTRQTSRLREVMPKVTNPAIHAQYAKAREEEGDLAEAERSYALAKETDSVIRLILRSYKNPERAFQLVRETRSQEGARMAAEYCQKSGDFRAAIEFLLMAKLFDEAFGISQQHESMDKLCEVLGDSGTQEMYARIADHYESRGDFPQAGKFYTKCQQYARALKLYLRSGEDSVLSAIDVVGQARDDNLTRMLIDFLMGDVDGTPKDPNYIFRLYMALGNYLQAARTALIISRQEQELGNYKVAHAILLDTFRVLDTHNIKIISELRRNLYLLHAYVLAKLLIKQKKHEDAARLLVRVARNISKFPSHTVPILTTAAIECYRVGMKKTAFEFAVQLVAPEYIKEIPQSYKRPIEQIVRKMDKTPDKAEPTTPCPACGVPLFGSELDCPSCKNFLPWCVVTGRHMVADDWCACPSCGFPALYSQFAPWVANKLPCPMCEEVVDPAAVQKIGDPRELVRRAIESVDITSLDQSAPQ